MSYGLELGLALLVAGAIGVAMIAANRTAKPAERDYRASTLLSGPEGSQALYRVLVRLGRRVERRRTALFGLAGDSTRSRRSQDALLAGLDPPVPLDPIEVDEVVQFVHHGGAVLAAGFGGGITRCAGWRIQPERALDDSVPVRPLPGDGGARLRLPRAARVLAPRPLRGRLEGLVKRSVAGESGDQCVTLVAQARDTLIAATDGPPVLLRLHYAGGGTITLPPGLGLFCHQ